MATFTRKPSIRPAGLPINSIVDILPHFHQSPVFGPRWSCLVQRGI